MNRDEYPFWEEVKVRWSDMDALGHVNNARYFTFLESARIQLFSQLETEAPAPGQGHGFTLVSAACNFRRQVRYPARLAIGTRIARIGTSSFELEHVMLLEEDGALAADAKSVVVWTDYVQERAAPLPDNVRARLEAMMQAPGQHEGRG